MKRTVEYFLWDRSKEFVVRATGLCLKLGSKRLLRQTKVEADRILTGKSRGLPAVQLTPKTLLLLRRVNSKQLGKYPRHFCFVNQSYVCPSLQCLITLFKLVTKIRKVILYSPNKSVHSSRSAPRNSSRAKFVGSDLMYRVEMTYAVVPLKLPFIVH